MGSFNIRSGMYGLSIHIDLFKLNLDIRLYSKADYEHTAGLRNSTEDGKRLVFLDYDDMLYREHLIPELRYLQRKYRLSEVYVFRSSQKEGSYHAICLDKLNAREWVKLLEETNCNQNYKRVPIYRDNKAWVLRFLPKKESKKPKIVEVLKAVSDKREKSKAHALFLHYNYGLKTKKLKNMDNFTNVTLTTYATLNYMK